MAHAPDPRDAKIAQLTAQLAESKNQLAESKNQLVESKKRCVALQQFRDQLVVFNMFSKERTLIKNCAGSCSHSPLICPLPQ